MSIPALTTLMAARGPGAPPPPLTIAEEFAGAHLLLLDPYDPASAPIVESDRMRLPDTSGAHNDAVRLVTPNTSGILPFTGTAPTIGTVDGNPALNFNGSADNLAGWFTGTPAGENWVKRSESMAADWTFTNTSASAGPTPPASTGATASVLLSGDATSGYHYASTILSPPAGGWQAGTRYIASCCFLPVAGCSYSMAQIDNSGWFQSIKITDGTLGPNSAGTVETHTIELLEDGWIRVWYTFTTATATVAAYPLVVWLLGPSGGITWSAAGAQIAVTAMCVHPTRTLTQGAKYHVTAGVPWYATPVQAATLVVVSRQTSPANNRAVFDSIDSSGGTNTGPMMGKETGRVARSFYGPAADLGYSSSNDASLIMQVATCNGLLDAIDADFYERTTRKHHTADTSTFVKPRLFYGVGRLINSTSILWPWLGDICFVGYWPAYKDATWIGAMAAKLGAKFPSMAA